MREILVKRLTEPCQLELTTPCPSMDLIATVSQRNTVDVWRFNGQRVFGLAHDAEDDSTVYDLTWKENGHLLAVLLSSGQLLLVDSFSGKTAHQFQFLPGTNVALPDWSSSRHSPPGSKVPRTTRPRLFWPSHFANPSSTQRQLRSADVNITLDDLLGLNADVEKMLNVKADLPRQLAQINVESSLPKLSTLPATGSNDDIFSTRNSVDAIFHPYSSTSIHAKANGDLVDLLLAGVRDCTLHIRIFDSFEIGNTDAAQTLPKGLHARRIIQHACHPFLSKHFILIEAELDGPAVQLSRQTEEAASLHLIELDLRFVPQTSDNLPLLAGKATQLQNLLRYIMQIQTQLSQEIRTAFDLPSRFVANIDESLAEQDSSSSFTTATYHLVLTGECNPTLKEWLVDQVGERGLKRWEKAVGDCLDLTKRMLSECLLPAIERSQIVVSRLDGLSRFADTAAKLGLEDKGIKSVRETLDVLTILCEDMLRDVCVETLEFGAFIRWIKWEAEVEALEDTSERAEEMRETYNGEAELRMVLDYISGAMRQSRVQAYIDIGKDAVPQNGGRWSREAQLYETYKEARRAKSDQSQLPKLGELVQHLRNQSEQVFSKVAENLRKNILGTHLESLAEDSNTVIMDSQVAQESGRDDSYILRILAQKAEEGEIAMYHRRIDSGKQEKGQWETIRVPPGWEVLDLKFGREGALLALIQKGGDRRLLFREGGTGSRDWENRYHFPGGAMSAGMKPSRLVVNGRKGRGTVTVADESGLGFVVLSLDS